MRRRRGFGRVAIVRATRRGSGRRIMVHASGAVVQGQPLGHCITTIGDGEPQHGVFRLPKEKAGGERLGVDGMSLRWAGGDR